MTDMQMLFHTVDELTADEWQQLYDYLISKNPPAVVSPDTPRIAGLHAHLGAVWMSDDFDDELPDEFWFGEI